MAGTLTGGWGYVIAAYGVTALILLGYTVSVVLRHRKERARLLSQEEGRHRPS